MASFIHDGVTIAYDDIVPEGGSGETVLLVHGFTSNRREGWRRTGWYDAVRSRGARCVALDQRGHGESEKLHDPEAYTTDKRAGDVLALMDHLGVATADMVGYSMGSGTVADVALAAPQRVSRLVLGGVGGAWLSGGEGRSRQENMTEAMLADDLGSITDPMARSFRLFVDEQGEDRHAMAACLAAPSTPRSIEALSRLPMPVLVVAGARDRLAGDPHELARIFPNGRGAVAPGCDHFSAIAHALIKAAVFDFFDGVTEEEADPFSRSF
jgi:pimeloyl-ACP methyl ester carboxylesterase